MNLKFLVFKCGDTLLRVYSVRRPDILGDFDASIDVGEINSNIQGVPKKRSLAFFLTPKDELWGF